MVFGSIQFDSVPFRNKMFRIMDFVTEPKYFILTEPKQIIFFFFCLEF